MQISILPPQSNQWTHTSHKIPTCNQIIGMHKINQYMTKEFLNSITNNSINNSQWCQAINSIMQTQKIIKWTINSNQIRWWTINSLETCLTLNSRFLNNRTFNNNNIIQIQWIARWSHNMASNYLTNNIINSPNKIKGQSIRLH